MTFYRRLIVLPLLAVLSSLLVAWAPSAHAVGSCSIYVPARVYVDSPYERIEGRLGADCASSDREYASWDVRHIYYGPTNLFIFDGPADTSDFWEFFDFEDLGTHRIEPSSAWDSNYDDLIQNERTTYVRLRSRLSLTGSRSGNYVTLNSTSRRYTPYYSRFGAWRNRPVAISYRTCATCSWRHLRTRSTGRSGSMTTRFYAPRVKYFRATTASTGGTWGKTSVTIRR